MKRTQAVIQVNIAVLLFGFVGLFPKWIALPAIGITCGRVVFSSIALGIFCLVRRQNIRVRSKRDLLMLLAAGVCLAMHWWLFLESIQVSTVAIGTITFSAFPLFVTFLEPLVFGEKLKKKDVFMALMVLVGVIITVPEFSLENSISKGIAIGILSAFLYAVLTLMNRFFTETYESTVIALYEQGTAAIVLLPVIYSMSLHPTGKDIGLLVLLGVVATALAYTLFVNSLKKLPATLSAIIATMESVYGIILAVLLLHEAPSNRELIGAIVIIGAVLIAQGTPNTKK